MFCVQLGGSVYHVPLSHKHYAGFLLPITIDCIHNVIELSGKQICGPQMSSACAVHTVSQGYLVYHVYCIGSPFVTTGIRYTYCKVHAS